MSARPYNNLESSLISDVLSTENTASETVGPTPTDLAYVAGYMDGEGCFRANKGNIEVQIKTRILMFFTIYRECLVDQYGRRGDRYLMLNIEPHFLSAFMGNLHGRWLDLCYLTYERRNLRLS